MKSENLSRIKRLLKDAPFADISYKEIKEAPHKSKERHAAKGEAEAQEYSFEGVSRFELSYPVLVCDAECAKRLSMGSLRLAEIMSFQRGVICGCKSARVFPFQKVMEAKSKGKEVYFGSEAVMQLLKRKGLCADDMFAFEIPVFKKTIEEKASEAFLVREVNYAAYRVILRKDRREFFLDYPAPALLGINESKLLEKAVREYYFLLEEKELL